MRNNKIKLKKKILSISAMIISIFTSVQFSALAVSENSVVGIFEQSKNWIFILSVCVAVLAIIIIILLIFNNRIRTLSVKAEGFQRSMRAAINNSDLMYFEYYPETHTAIEMNGRENFDIDEIVENYPEEWFEKKITHPDDEKILRDAFDRVDNGETIVKCEVRNIIDGRYHWHRYSFVNIIDENGKREKASCTVLDITQQKEDEEAYYNQETIMQKLYPNTRCWFKINLSKNTVNSVSVSDEHLIGAKQLKSADELFEFATGNAISKEKEAEFKNIFDVKKLKDSYKKGIDEVSIIQRYRKKNGEYLWTRTVAKTFENPSTHDIEAIILAINVDREMREQLIIKHLTENEYDFIATIDVNSHHFTILNEDQEATGRFIIYNSDYTKNYILFVEAQIVDEDKELVKNQIKLETIMKELDENDFYSIVIRQKSENGIIYKQQRYSYIDEEKTTIILSKLDITKTQRKEEERIVQMQNALEEIKQANKAKTDFLSNMSHEIRTPMNAIIGMTKLAEDELIGQKNIKEYLEEIDSSSSYLLGVINDILDMSRIESGKMILHPDWVKPKEIILSCIDMVEPMMKQRGINFEYPKMLRTKSTYEFMVDAQKTKQMIMNLLNNACKFTNEGGHISIYVQNVCIDKKNQTATDKTIVSDDGCGMSEEFLTRVFNPFEQERKGANSSVQGTGLGLALSRNIARSMGGDITVKSELGKGSEFTITYTYKYRLINEDSSKDYKKRISTDGLRDKHIILAEDHPLNATIATKLLNREGVKVTLAENGKIAVDIFKNNPSHTFDAIIMDIRMPVMDGMEAAKAIRAIGKKDSLSIPIIAMTANAFDEDIKATKAAGMNAHLSKPVEPQKMYETLAEVIK